MFNDWKDIIKMTKDGKTFEFPLYYDSIECCQMATFALTGSIAEVGISIEHYVYAKGSFLPTCKGNYERVFNKRKGIKDSNKNIKFASIYTVRDPKTEEEFTFETTFINDQVLMLLADLMTAALKRFFVSVHHYRKEEEWIEVSFPTRKLKSLEQISKEEKHLVI